VVYGQDRRHPGPPAGASAWSGFGNQAAVSSTQWPWPEIPNKRHFQRAERHCGPARGDAWGGSRFGRADRNLRPRANACAAPVLPRWPGQGTLCAPPRKRPVEEKESQENDPGRSPGQIGSRKGLVVLPL